MFWKVAAKILKGASRQDWKDDGDDQEDDQEKDDEDGCVIVDDDDEDDKDAKYGVEMQM